jgi:hypothetical protein
MEHPSKAHFAIHIEYAPPYEYPTEYNGNGVEIRHDDCVVLTSVENTK